MRDAFASDTATTAAPAEVPQALSAEKMMTDNMLLLGAIFFIFYFLIIRPQQKRVKMHNDLIKSLDKGQRVITSGGLIGTIAKLEGNDVLLLEIAQGIKVRVARASVSEVFEGSTADSANDN